MKKRLDNLLAWLFVAGAGSGAVGCVVLLWALPIAAATAVVVGVLWMLGVLPWN